MADLKLIRELGFNDTLLVLEPSRKCVAHCTWCYAELAHKIAEKAGKPRKIVVPDTLGRYVNRAFGPDYDPTDFIQWSLHNRSPVTWASGVEPFQDLPQALAILDMADRLDLPLFIQTRGTNWREVWDAVLARKGQVALYVSMPSPDPGYVKRYEPGTPPPSEREAMIRAAADAGIPVMLALAPYHPTWCADLPGHVRTAVEDWGVKGVFFDPLHLNRNQIEVAGDGSLSGLCASVWDDPAVEHLTAAKAICVEAGITWYSTTWKAPIHRLESVDPFGWFGYERATRFHYHDEAIFEAVHPPIDADDSPPLVVTWEAALAAMERRGKVDQRFSWRSLGDQIIGGFTRPGQHPTGPWLDRLKHPSGATLADYLQAYWNTPRAGGFFWRHPFVRLAMRPDGTPWTSDSGNAVAIFDPSYESRKFNRTVEDLSAYRTLAV